MAEQLSFDGFEVPPSTPPAGSRGPRVKGDINHLLFFAIRPPIELRARIEAVGRRVHDELGGYQYIVEQRRQHITLLQVYSEWDLEPSPEQVNAICAAADSLAVDSFPIVFDRVMSFGGDALVLAGLKGANAELARFQQQLAAAVPLKGRSQSFHAHTTMRYGPRLAADIEVEPIGWEAKSFELIHSLQGRHEYRHLGEWALKPRAT